MGQPRLGACRPASDPRLFTRVVADLDAFRPQVETQALKKSFLVQVAEERRSRRFEHAAAVAAIAFAVPAPTALHARGELGRPADQGLTRRPVSRQAIRYAEPPRWRRDRKPGLQRPGSPGGSHQAPPAVLWPSPTPRDQPASAKLRHMALRLRIAIRWLNRFPAPNGQHILGLIRFDRQVP